LIGFSLSVGLKYKNEYYTRIDHIDAYQISGGRIRNTESITP